MTPVLALLLACAPAAAPLRAPAPAQAPVAAGGEELGGWRATIEPLLAPHGVDVDAQGRIWIAETGAHRVRAFTASGEELLAFGARGGAAGELFRPRGIAVSDAGEVFVADTGNHRLQVFDAQGELLRGWGGLGAGAGRFHTPLDLALSGERLAVADQGNARVQLFDLAGRELATVGAGTLARPTDVAFDAEGRLWVADADLNRIFAFDQEGAPVATFGDWGWFPGLFSEPSGLDFAAERLWVADRENHRVQVFDDEGSLDYKWGIHAIRPREGEGKLHYPTDVALAPDASFAVLSEPLDGRVQVFGAIDEATREEARLRQFGTGQPSSHYGFDVSAAGPYLALVEPETHRVLVWDLRWEEPLKISELGGYGERLGLLARPRGLHLGEDRTLLVCDAGNARVQRLLLEVDPEAEVRFDPEMARWIDALDFRRLGRRIGDLELEWTVAPVGVARSPEGTIFVLDAANERVFAFDEDWRYLWSAGGHGDEPGRLREPSALAFAPAREGAPAELFVVDAGNGRVQAYDPRSGEPRRVLASGLRHPFGVAVAVAADGSVLVSDTEAHRVLRFDRGGEQLSAFGERGLLRLQLDLPRGLALDGAGRLYVIDHANHRGMVVTPEGEYVGVFGSRLYTRPARLQGRADTETDR